MTLPAVTPARPFIVVMDTETSGLPKNYKAPLSELDNWPRVIQLSWSIYTANGELVKDFNWIIRPDGFTIPPEATAIHGITQEQAEREGIAILTALVGLAGFIRDEDPEILVGHNLEYDLNVVQVEYMRAGWTPPFDRMSTVDTMKGSTDYCKLPGKYGYKWPKLAELYYKLFGETFEGGHNAVNDIHATARCFFELVRLGVIRPFPPEEIKNENPFPSPTIS